VLTGLKILEISSFVAAPLCGMTLAQLGAEVIRVDPLGGAPDVRRWPVTEDGTSIYWAGLNKGKRSIALDLRSEPGRELVRRLAGQAGIVVTNARYPSYQDLVTARPDLIHVQIEGHHDGRPAVDYTVNAEMGFPQATGPAGHDGPVNNVVPAWDIACGLYAAIGILAAERHRSRTGAGQSIRLPLADVALATAGNLGYLGEAAINGVDRPRIGNHLYGGFARDFATRDGRRVMIVTLTPRHFLDLGDLTGTREIFAELERLLRADFGRDADRYRHRETIAALVEPWFAGHLYTEVAKGLDGTSLLWSPYRSFTELVGDAAGNPLLTELDQPGIGRLPVPGSPLNGLGAALAPVLGADTAGVLRDLLGLAEADLADLRDRGVI
jgi:2-methylfumaryl-CoA isomerase